MSWRSSAERLWLVTMRLLWSHTPRDILRFLPGSSVHFGPPRRHTSWPRYRSENPVKWKTVYPSRDQTLPSPFFCNDSLYAWKKAQQITWPEFGVAEIPHARLLDEHGWVVGKRDQHLRDFDFDAGRRSLLLNHIISLRSIRSLKGRVLNLSTAHGSHNFYHYVVDGISRMHLVEKAGYNWNDFDHVILPRFRSPMTIALEKAAGIPSEKIIRLGRRDHVTCELLIQPSYPGWTAQTPWWVVEYLRKLMPPLTAEMSRKIYLPRGGSRNPTHLKRMEQRLSELGFEQVDPANLPELREKLGSASHVVAAHGAALANVFLCPVGTRVLELLPSDFAYCTHPCYYYTLCAGGDLPYGAIVGRSTRPTRFAFSLSQQSSFDIHWDHFEAGLSALLAG